MHVMSIHENIRYDNSQLLSNQPTLHTRINS